MISIVMVLSFCGCGSYSAARDERTRNTVNVQNVKLELDGVRQSVNELTGTDEDIYGRIDKLSKDINEISAEVENMKRALAEIKADRERLRQEIINQLAPKISEAINSSRARAPVSSGGEYYEHVVQSGETLSAIASTYGVSVASIISANKIKDAHLIRAGQKILVPKK